MTSPLEELQRIAGALQALAGGRAEFELWQDPVTFTVTLRAELESLFAPRVILTTSDIRRLPLTLVTCLSEAPETVICDTLDDLDEALAAFVASAGMHQFLTGIMSG